MSTKLKIIISIILIATGVASRLLPHAWNFAPIAAIALFSGAYLGGRYAAILPVLSLFIGDLALGFYEWHLGAAVYGSFLLIGLLSSVLSKRISGYRVISLSIASSLLFFFITNWAVWQFSPWYAPSIKGLLDCYVMGLPFLRNTMLGDLFFSGAFFGAYEFILVMTKSRVNIFARISS